MGRVRERSVLTLVKTMNWEALVAANMSQWAPVLGTGGVGMGLALVILGASYLRAPVLDESDKLGAYECGFDPFGDARNEFDVRFYLVAILFIVFDLEAVFVFPWAVALESQGSLGVGAMADFLAELLVGLLYAWKVGALEWD